AALDNVVLIEGARPMVEELDQSLKAIRADQVHGTSAASLGAGALIGLIDSGINFRHDCFRDESGQTRIAAIWDQTLDPSSPGEKPPLDFKYGVEYERDAINEDLALPEGAARKVRHVPRKEHGTHVAG